MWRMQQLNVPIGRVADRTNDLIGISSSNYYYYANQSILVLWWVLVQSFPIKITFVRALLLFVSVLIVACDVLTMYFICYEIKYYT